MSTNNHQPSRRFVNAAISILVICSIGAAIEGTGCIDVRYSSCKMFAGFLAHVPFYVLGAVAISELFYWGGLGRLRNAKNAFSRFAEERPDISLNFRKAFECLLIGLLTVGALSVFFWMST